MARKLIVSDRGNIVNLENLSVISPTMENGEITGLDLYYAGSSGSQARSEFARITAAANPEGLKLVIEWMRRNSLQAPTRGEDGRFVTSG